MSSFEKQIQRAPWYDIYASSVCGTYTTALIGTDTISLLGKIWEDTKL